MIGITGCTSNGITHQSSVKEIREKIVKVRTEIPSEYLLKCDWLSPLEGNTQSALLKTNEENVKKHKECILIHNSFVDYYNNILKASQ